MRHLVLLVWIVGSSLILTRLAFTHPALQVRFPAAFSDWVTQTFSIVDAEHGRDVEGLIIFSGAVALMTALTVGARFVLVRLRTG